MEVRVHYLPQEPQLDEAQSVQDVLFYSDSPTMQLVRAYERAVAALQHNPTDPDVQAHFAHLSAEMDRLDGWAAATRVKMLLSRLGLSDFEARVGALSGGMRKRLALARALLGVEDESEEATFKLLILDEPTNHVDADTIDWLEQYLLSTPAALFMVTHDRYFLNRVVNRIIELDRRQLTSYPGNYMRYLEQSAEQHDRLVKAEEDRRRALRRELEWLRRSPMARGAKQKARIVPGEALDYFVIYRPTPKEALARYTALTGRRSRPRGRSGCGSPHPSPHPTTRRPSPVSSRAWPIAISRCTSSIAGDAVQKDPLGALLIPHADAGTVTVRL